MPGGVEPTNLAKVFWPEAGLTKGDLIGYFEAVAPFALKALRDRPLTVKRYPDGIDKFAFYQKNTPNYAPSWVQTITLHAEAAKRDVSYTLCNSKRTLLWLANQAAIELHPWLSLTNSLERPTHLVLDLDPPEGRFDLAVEIAHLAKEVCDEAGLATVAKTSGAKGIHVYAPLQRRYDFAIVRQAAATIARRIEEQAPDLSTTEFKIADRGNRLYLDAGRNAPGAHTIAAYSPRARPLATVSFPVPWKDLKRVDPADFTIRTVPAITRREGDRWARLMPAPQTMPKTLLKD
jgi:bifunctional non-homologous end joining protein LigD